LTSWKELAGLVVVRYPTKIELEQELRNRVAVLVYEVPFGGSLPLDLLAEEVTTRTWVDLASKQPAWVLSAALAPSKSAVWQWFFANSQDPRDVKSPGPHRYQSLLQSFLALGFRQRIFRLTGVLLAFLH